MKKNIFLLTAAMATASVVASASSTAYTETPRKRFTNFLGLTTPAETLFNNSLSNHFFRNAIPTNEKNLADREKAIKDSIKYKGLLTADTSHYEFDTKTTQFSLYNPNGIRNFAAYITGAAVIAGVGYAAWRLAQGPEKVALSAAYEMNRAALDQAKDAIAFTAFASSCIGLPFALLAGYKTNDYFKVQDRRSVIDFVKSKEQ